MKQYKITSDANQWLVQELTILGKDSKTPGEERIRPVSYHLTLAAARESLVERGLRDLWPKEGVETGEVAAVLSRLSAPVRQMLEGAGEGE